MHRYIQLPATLSEYVAEQIFASQGTKGFGSLINFKTRIFVESPLGRIGFLWPFSIPPDKLRDSIPRGVAGLFGARSE